MHAFCAAYALMVTEPAKGKMKPFVRACPAWRWVRLSQVHSANFPLLQAKECRVLRVNFIMEQHLGHRTSTSRRCPRRLAGHVHGAFRTSLRLTSRRSNSTRSAAGTDTRRTGRVSSVLPLAQPSCTWLRVHNAARLINACCRLQGLADIFGKASAYA